MSKVAEQKGFLTYSLLGLPTSTTNITWIFKIHNYIANLNIHPHYAVDKQIDK